LGILSLPDGGSTIAAPFGEEPAMEGASGRETDEYRRASVPSGAAKITRLTGMKS
jgi:hypothetical protein